jgi:hypothetical protein
MAPAKQLPMARDESTTRMNMARGIERDNNNVRVAVHFNEIFMSQYDVK